MTRIDVESVAHTTSALLMVCTSPGDYANEIEPSMQGGAKIAELIVAIVTGNISGEQTQVYW